ncbi:helix-turn-helix domain-containing protein [Candidatus Enterococcus clewellii]|uniref:Helix-turn-helix domain-containing protein n=1 Tax=Candidatus Enterococcus clewellii TaxID=1834193 RepID=A0A242KBW3_9ENTE|nr:helix-turn-helix domain-containing protein [Enterococcus sp. 9E7_DIV0242]OTP18642.1 hypothetical protein A5888_000456 [Enterococcus sp. 9E7_DIV0242]
MIDLTQVLTFTEAAEKWQLAGGNTLRQAVARGRFHEAEIRKSGTVWLTTYEAMTRVFGPLPASKASEEPLIFNQTELYSAIKKGPSSADFKKMNKQAALAFSQQRQLQVKEKIFGKEIILYLFTDQTKWDSWLTLTERSLFPRNQSE